MATKTRTILTKEQEEYLLKMMGKWNDGSVAKAIGISKRHVQYVRHKLGIPPCGVRWNENMVEELNRLWEEYQDLSKVAEHLGIKPTSLATQLSTLRAKGVFIPYYHKKEAV